MSVWGQRACRRRQNARREKENEVTTSEMCLCEEIQSNAGHARIDRTCSRALFILDVDAFVALPSEADSLFIGLATSSVEWLVHPTGRRAAVRTGACHSAHECIASSQLFDQTTSTYTYLLADGRTREALIIDPVLSTVARDMQLIKQLGLFLRYASTHSFRRLGQWRHTRFVLSQSILTYMLITLRAAAV